MGDRISLFSAFRRPFTNIAKLFLASILFTIPLLNLFTIGFLYNCIKQPKDLPRWRLFYFIDGLKIFLIILIYSIPFLLLFYIIYLLEIPANSTFIMPFYIVTLFTIYSIPAAIVNFAKSNQIIKNTFKFALTRKYFIAFAIGILWAVGLNSISIILTRTLHYILPLSLFAIITWFVSIILLIASQITFLTLISQAYEKSR
ncbi:hypothetical protein KY314_03650 [Candidatus Woesearchaeota archaeon]|nr:hypothetical protein [Candidatus Woesearchaeota archaeon]